MSRVFGYDDKRVVVSGGGGAGMGAAVVEALVGLGAEVHVLDLREPPVDVASHQVVDLRDPDAVDGAVERIGGVVHSLFNCAGVSGPPFFSDLDTMLVNFAAPRHLASLLAPRMTDGGAICSISSIAGAGWMLHMDQWRPLLATRTFAEAADWIESHRVEIAGGYAPSKEALIMWTHEGAYDFAARGVRCNCVSPGVTTTPMTAQFDEIPGATVLTDQFVQGLGRNATPAEQAWPMIFLNSDLASYVVGENLNVDAGAVGAMATGRMVLGSSTAAAAET